MSELDKYIISSKPGENPGKCIAILSGVGVYYSENALTVTDDSPGSKPLPTEDGILSTGQNIVNFKYDDNQAKTLSVIFSSASLKYTYGVKIKTQSKLSVGLLQWNGTGENDMYENFVEQPYACIGNNFNASISGLTTTDDVIYSRVENVAGRGYMFKGYGDCGMDISSTSMFPDSRISVVVHKGGPGNERGLTAQKPAPVPYGDPVFDKVTSKISEILETAKNKYVTTAQNISALYAAFYFNKLAFDMAAFPYSYNYPLFYYKSYGSNSLTSMNMSCVLTSNASKLSSCYICRLYDGNSPRLIAAKLSSTQIMRSTSVCYAESIYQADASGSKAKSLDSISCVTQASMRKFSDNPNARLPDGISQLAVKELDLKFNLSAMVNKKTKLSAVLAKAKVPAYTGVDCQFYQLSDYSTVSKPKYGVTFNSYKSW